MEKKLIFEGAGVAIVTPFNEDGSINFNELRRIIDAQIENSTDAIVICGTTGESATLTTHEHLECIEVAIEQTAGRVPVIAGTGSNDTDYCVWLSKEAEKLGADALLLVTPYYNKCTQKGLVAHFTKIADAVAIPLILYNIPGRTGVAIQPETLFELSKHERIVAVKEASGDMSSIAKTASLCGDKLAIYSGNDDQILPILSLGGKGVISVLSHIAPRDTHDMVRLYLDGDTRSATELQLKLIPVINALFAEVNPIPVKAAMCLKGYRCEVLRLPLTPAENSTVELLKSTMTATGLL